MGQATEEMNAHRYDAPTTQPIAAITRENVALLCGL